MKMRLIALFLVLGSILYAEKSEINYQLQLQDCEYEALVCFIDGSTYLLSHEFAHSLKCLQQGKLFLSKDSHFSQPIEFLLIFSEVIAYDCLGLRDQCKQALGSLILNINYDNEKKEEKAHRFEIEDVFEESKYTIEFLQCLIALTPSDDINEVLSSLVEDISNEILFTLKFLQANEEAIHSPISLNGKSFWKKSKKWLTEFTEWFCLIAKIFKTAKEIRDTYHELRERPSSSYEIKHSAYNKSIVRLGCPS